MLRDGSYLGMEAETSKIIPRASGTSVKAGGLEVEVGMATEASRPLTSLSIHSCFNSWKEGPRYGTIQILLEAIVNAGKRLSPDNSVKKRLSSITKRMRPSGREIAPR